MGTTVIRLAFKNMWRSRTRTILTLTVVGAGMALFAALTSISADLKQQLDHTMARTNIDVIIQEKGSATPVASRFSVKTVNDIQQLEAVKSVSPVIVGSIRTKGLPYLFLFGGSVGESYLSLAEWLGTGLIDGSMFQPGKNQVLLGRTAARILKKQVGDMVVLGAADEFRVSGIYWGPGCCMERFENRCS
jgi:putative ABC transport system permease protein